MQACMHARTQEKDPTSEFIPGTHITCSDWFASLACSLRIVVCIEYFSVVVFKRINPTTEAIHAPDKHFVELLHSHARYDACIKQSPKQDPVINSEVVHSH